MTASRASGKGTPSGVPTRRPTLTEAREAAQQLLDAADKVSDLLAELDLAFDHRPLRDARQVIDDVDGYLTVTATQLGRVLTYIERTREKHGWHD